MLKKIHKFKAQSVGEYAITISIVILAVMGMTYFIQRLFSARINDARGYMMTTLNPDIYNVHISRNGAPYSGILAEYEPYTMNRISQTLSTPQSNVLINGPVDIYTSRSQSLILMNSVSTETPAQDDD